MPSKIFSYQLLRYIPDLSRMEPRNFGIVLQDDRRIQAKIYPYLASSGDVETKAFHAWKEFIEKEINNDDSEQLQLFRPAKSTKGFLEYLTTIIKGNFTISKPMVVQFNEEIDFDEVIDSLYKKLVVRKEERDSNSLYRPTGKFRQISLEKKFRERGLEEDKDVNVGLTREETVYRVHKNGNLFLVQKVEFNQFLHSTALELSNVLSFCRDVKKEFFKENEGHIILDQHKKFGKQTEEDAVRFYKKREEIGNVALEKNMRVYDTPEKIDGLSNIIDRRLASRT